MVKWKMVAFNNVITIINGKNQKQVENPSGKYPIYGSGGVMGYADDYLCDGNTVVIGRKGTINKPIFVEVPFWNVDTAFGLRPNDAVLYPKYLFYFCEQYDFESLNTTVTIPSLTKANLLQIVIPLPPLDVQQKIANVLDEASALIELRKAQLDKLDLLIKSQFIEMFGDPLTNPMQWNVRRLGEICSVGSSKRVFVDDLVEQGVPFYRGTEIGALSLGENVIPTLFITEKHYNDLKSKTGVPTIGDLLMPSICPDGRIWRVDTKKPFYFKDGRVLWVHPETSNIDSIFLQFALRNKLISDYHNFASGSTFSELKIFSLKNVPIILPPVNLQKQFCTFVQQTKKIKLELQQSLSKLELNYKSLMQKCFRGEIF